LMMMQEKCISPDADHEMIQILLDQRLNGKIPFFLHAIDIDVAHKTGEDSGTTHDVAIVMTKTPFVLCFASNDTDVARFERLMQDIALELAVANNQ
ncbi:MAG: serine hydrolase, partial [Clostridia bacterium]|nr:serine hydrolase [Clostridia bacterium]